MEGCLAISHAGANGQMSGRLMSNRIAALCKDCVPVRRRSPQSNGGRDAIGDIRQQHVLVSAGTDVITQGEPTRSLYTVCDGWLVQSDCCIVQGLRAGAAAVAAKQRRPRRDWGYQDVITQGEPTRSLYTVCDGWLVSYQRLRSGVRQILDVLLPGDTVALASVFLGMSSHSVQAITNANLCMLNGRQVVGLLKNNPGLAFGVLQDRVRDERRADARTTMLGRMRAEEKLGYFMVEIFDRLQRRGMANGVSCPFPLRRNDVADAVGLSKVHVSRAMRELRSQDLVDIRGQDMIIPDVVKLAGCAGYMLT